MSTARPSSRVIEALPREKRVTAVQAIASGQRISEGALTLCPCGNALLYHPERLLNDRAEKIADLWFQAHLARHTRICTAAWRTARSLDALGHLMADWLEGHIPSRPGRGTRCGPDPETQDLIPTLAACNRAGYVTTDSQPGHTPELGYDGRMWTQRASVMGLIASERLLIRLMDQAEAAELTVIVHGPGRLATGPGRGLPVTTVDGDPCTGFGMKLSRGALKREWYGVGPDARRQVLTAWQVTLVDPDWGRNDRLWPLLDGITTA